MSAISLMGAHSEKPVIRAPGIDDRVADAVSIGGDWTKVCYWQVLAALSVKELRQACCL